MKLALHGATGRMGRTITRLCHESGEVQIVGAVSRFDDPELGKDLGELSGVGSIGVAVGPDAEAALLGAECVIDFSLPQAVVPLLKAARRARVAVVMGTTGLGEPERAALADAAESIPVLWARNMSLGIQVLAELVEKAVRDLGAQFDVEITDIHHKHKQDSPSGTAKRLADAVHSARPNSEQRYAREGETVGHRGATETGVFGLRGGDVIGDHTVHLLGPGERLELTHRATNRDLFAHGAIRAARWLVGKPAGSYAISDVLQG